MSLGLGEAAGLAGASRAGVVLALALLGCAEGVWLHRAQRRALRAAVRRELLQWVWAQQRAEYPVAKGLSLLGVLAGCFATHPQTSFHFWCSTGAGQPFCPSPTSAT